MSGELSKHIQQGGIVQKPEHPMRMHSHIIPRRSRLLVGIPAGAHISMWTGKYGQHLRIVFKTEMMIGLALYMTEQEKLSLPFFHQQRYMGSNRLVITVTAS